MPHIKQQILRSITPLVISAALVSAGCNDSALNNAASTNSEPKISAMPQQRVVSGGFYDYTPQASDDDNDTLVFEAINLPEWLRIDTATGNIYGTPGFDQLGIYRGIQIQVSDGEHTVVTEPFDIEVGSPLFRRDNFEPTGTVIDTGMGYNVQGDMSMRFDNDNTKTWQNSDLQLDFDEDGNLLDLAGEGALPKEMTDHVAIDTGVRATFGLFSGAEINADEDFGVTLLEDRQYLLYYLDYGSDLVIKNPVIPEQEITVSAPPIPHIPKFILIEDPYDPMVYYGDGGDFAVGMSLQGLIPYRPLLDHSGLASFEGHGIAKQSVSVGYKIMDFLKFSGELVVLDPRMTSLFDILNGHLDPEPSWLDFKLGFNGTTEFELSVLSIGLFAFDIGQSSATMEAGQDGLILAIDGLIEPDVAWAPSWMPFIPQSKITADFYANDKGTLNANLSGAYRSTLPQADVEGSMHITLDAVTMQAIVRDRIDIPASITFGDNETHAEIELNVAFENEINAAVSSAFDRAEQQVHQAIANLEAATADYEFEVSLGGVREGIPAIADAAIAKLNTLPQTVRNAVDTAVVAKIKAKCISTVTNPFNGKKSCVAYASDVVNETAIGDQAGNDAKAQAQEYVDQYIPVFEELKFRVQQADDESLRVALEQALRTAYDHRRINKTISGSKSLGSVPVYGNIGSVSYSYTLNEQILSDSNASLINTAANNASRIQQSSDIMISSQQLFDSLPTTDAIANVREKVETGASQVPGVESAAYHVVHGNYSAEVKLDDGSTHTVHFNMLSLDEAITGISDLLVAWVIERDG